jgi:hypothetical protein
LILALQNPAAYGPDLAMMLKNLAALYYELHHDGDATGIEAQARAAAR